MKLCVAYFFFDDFLLLDADFFEDEDLEDFFDAAIRLTTFHAVRDLPVAPIWHTAGLNPAILFDRLGGGWPRRRRLMTFNGD
jgi:hypothetical protein